MRSVAVQPDSAILVGGEFSTVGGISRPFFARLAPGGNLDTGFSPGAVVGVAARTIAAYPDGKVLVGGQFTYIGSAPRTRLARMNSDGSVDTTFDPGAGADNEVFALAVQPDGRILVGGQFTNVNNPQESISWPRRVCSASAQKKACNQFTSQSCANVFWMAQRPLACA